MEEKIFKEEEKYLFNTLNVLNDKLSEIDTQINSENNDLESTNQEYIDYLKANANRGSEEDSFELGKMQENLSYQEKSIKQLNAEKLNYSKMLNKPYFARIDLEKKSINGKYYIGLHSLVNNKKEFQVIDWRAPISSIFYSYEKGNCQIQIDGRQEKFLLTNKRQFGIDKGKLEYYVDTNINIDDELLQETLAKNTTAKMQNIVQTIQKEQNEIIRAGDNKTLVVQGGAGSGKTAIALHRVAYLLYIMRGKIKSSDIMFLSPNSAFSSYISSVLPDLAEDDIEKLQLDEFARHQLLKYLILERRSEQMERLIQEPNLKEYKYKISYEFLSDSLNYFKENYINNFIMPDFTILTETINGNEITKLFKKYNHFSDLNSRIIWLTNKIYDKYFFNQKNPIKVQNIKQDIFETIFKTIENKNCIKAYMNFLKSKNLTLKLVGKKVKNEDAYGILLFKILIFGCTKFTKIKHLIIDEMQDYSMVQHYIIKTLFNCPMTILGDYNQSITPSEVKDNLTHLNKVYGENIEYVEIYKSYRSTVQITNFSNNYLSHNNIKCVSRKGEDVEIIATHPNKVNKTIFNSINECKAKGYRSIAVITKTNNTALSIFKELKTLIPSIILIDDSLAEYNNKTCVIPVFNSKGLEFDAVIILDVDKLSKDIDNNLMYIATTRALHKLIIVNTKNKKD